MESELPIFGLHQQQDRGTTAQRSMQLAFSPSLRRNRHSRRIFLLASAVLAAIGNGAFAREVAEANLDLNAGTLCFPLQLSADARTFDVCMKLEQVSPVVRFSLTSAVPAPQDLAGIPTYSPQAGLQIPLVRLADGRVFTDVSFAVTLDTSTSTFSFVLDAIRRLDLDHNIAEHSVARLWNEALLNSIRSDLARPTVHARNLFHSSAAMYDAWTAFDTTAEPWLLGKTLNGYTCTFTGMPMVANVEEERAKAISYAAYRVLRHRFANSPGASTGRRIHDDLMRILGFDPAEQSRDYSQGSGAALGNHIGDCIIAYGLLDGSNEANAYAPLAYSTVNPPLSVSGHGNPTMLDPDRWQPLAFEQFVDQSGNVFLGATPTFVTPEWGRVQGFALSQSDLSIYQRDGAQWWVYHDPARPPLLANAMEADDYKWSHQMVAIWASHLDPADNVLWDISPASIGNIPEYPTTLAGQRGFYDVIGGGDTSQGRELNPVTGMPYAAQIVPRGDYTRVLAQYWADGPRSETPPGHWFTIFNTVADHPLLEKQYRGTGPLLSDLEWDVKGYFMMGATMHDVAVTAWGIKGWYDSSRPVSVIRYMAEKGQSSDPTASNYDPEGFELVPGYIETVLAGDPLAGPNMQNVGKIKLYTWRGPTTILDPINEIAGVGWILAEDWWPFQTQTFVTPPFAGYISGHSTFSRAAAEVMTRFTGDEYFPGGMSEFVARKDQFLGTEKGPSVDVILQWATYTDASDQTSLSRIWGGIHPPMDDMPGRHIGTVVGIDAFTKADTYFRGTAP